MKFNFKENLKKYTDTIKQEKENGFNREGKIKSVDERNKAIEDISSRAHTTPEAEQQIYDIQKSKLEKLNKFKKFLEKTRTESGFTHAAMNPELAKTVPTISFRDGQFVATSPDGKHVSVSLAEIMTDNEWGLQYTFDNSVNIHDIRKYYLEQLKSDLREKLDTQIIISETANTHSDTFKQNAYRAIGERMENGSEQGGVIAEKMVKNFLKKLTIETDADFEIIDADVHQDVEQKIDFIIHRKNNERNRGAKIEQSDTATDITFQDIGIQFTMNTNKTEHKEKQINNAKKHLDDNIDDIVLVTLPIEQASNLYKKWNQNPSSGGPEKSWDIHTQEQIFRGVMDRVLSQDEIDEFCERNFK